MRVALIILFACIFGRGYAQDAIFDRIERVVSSAGSVFTSDSLPKLVDAKGLVSDTNKISRHSLTSLAPLDSIRSITDKQGTHIMQIHDSIQKILLVPNTVVHNVKEVIKSKSDSLLHKINHPVKGPQNAITAKQDSLKRRIGILEQKLDAKIQNAKNGLQQDLDKATDGKLKIPDNKLQLPDHEIKLPAQDLKAFEDVPELPAADIDVAISEIPATGDLNIPDLDMKQVSENAGFSVPDVEKINNLSREISEGDGKLAEVQQYEQELREIKQNGIRDAQDLAGELERSAENVEGIKALNEGKQKVTEYQNIIQRYKDKKLLKQEIRRKASNIANDYLIKKAPQIKKATEQFGKSKTLLGKVRNAKSLVKRQRKEMQAKKFHQRLVPSLTTQVYRMELVTIDFGFQIGYRFTPRLTAGAGGIYRANFGEVNKYFVKYAAVYGGRSYVEFALVKGLFLHGEFEALKIGPLAFKLTNAEKLSEEALGSYFGFGKRFNISRKIKGTVLGLYRVEYMGSLPNVSPISMRMGFEYDMIKKKRRRLFTVKTW